MLSINQNPPQLSTQYESPDQVPGEWYIAHVKSRNEKALAGNLSSFDIPYYLPMIRRQTFSGNRKRENLYPLFTSYLFFAGWERRYEVMATNRVANVIEVADQERFIREIRSIHRVLESGNELEIHAELPLGRLAEVVKGPMKGTVGTVIGNRPWDAITLSIGVLSVGAELKISGDLLELIDQETEEHNQFKPSKGGV